MALNLYKQKRSFDKTPEPTGGVPDKQEMRFVVQKHAATNLHYDFRLEIDGVLKSWAVPKGPSTNPADKRLAMMVEDHPYDYRSFEGIIPKGEYGGGTVIVWDEGNYMPATREGGDKKKMEKELRQQLKEGKVVLMLNGEKLKGEYALVKTKGRGENAWLLMKAKDEYASETDITEMDKSVISGKTLEQVARDGNEAPSKRTSAKKKAATKAAPKKKQEDKGAAEVKDTIENEDPVEAEKAAPAITDLLKKATKSSIPSDLMPMLATLVDKPFDQPGWQYEIKWDGYRALAYINKGEVTLRSRNNKSFDEKFYPVTAALKNQPMDAVLDGEIIVADENGMANFGQLQNWRSEADGSLFFYVFDILWLNGQSLMELPLAERAQILKHYLVEDDTVHLSVAFDGAGTDIFASAAGMGLEGIMAKRMNSVYMPGDRNTHWLKIKTDARQEVVIGGFTKNAGSAKSFSSLLVGVWEGDQLRYTGKVGTGFSEKLQATMMQAFRKLIVKSCPFDEIPDVNKPSRFRDNSIQSIATWLKPSLVCEVSFREMTSDGVMRHPAFKGMRDDKPAKEVVLEKEVPVAKALTPKKIPMKNKPDTSSRKTLLNPSEETQVKTIQGHQVKFTNLSKLYWPKEKISKRDMLNYYYQIAPYMLPYLKDRPQSLNRHPNGIEGKSFYQKDVTGKVPDWIEQFPYTSEGVDKNFLVCNNEASLLYMASLGCIELNPWSSRITKPDNPDWCIIDLDPGKKNTFEQVIEVANVTHEVLEAASIPSYCKTSGSTGLHIYIPLNARYTYEESKEFGRIIAHLVNNQLPAITSIERAVVKRKGKLYIDFLQNRPQATLAAAYSVRPKPFATVSMPLHWEEVKKGLQMKDFTIKNAVARVKDVGDIFSPVLGKGINMPKVLKALQSLDDGK